MAARGRPPADRAAAEREALTVATERDAAGRAADHAAIDRLADELLPALSAKLAASSLAEIEVREGDWRIRLRRPADGIGSPPRRGTERPSRTQPGHAGHGHAPAAVEGHRSVTGRDGTAPLAVGPGHPVDGDGAHQPAADRAVATSPAVGIFQPRAELRPGTRVRSGDRLGYVDVLGVRQEVVSPVDGIVGASLVEGGDAVEYGQELVRLESAAGHGGTGG
ncbi:MAG: acetyl-CoA carboxylase biotin carboxyl carrier protein [Candidatus Limnocylindrales bacterium]